MIIWRLLVFLFWYCVFGLLYTTSPVPIWLNHQQDSLDIFTLIIPLLGFFFWFLFVHAIEVWEYHRPSDDDSDSDGPDWGGLAHPRGTAVYDNHGRHIGRVDGGGFHRK